MKEFMALITGIGLTALASAGNQASLKHGEATTEYALVTNAIAHAASGDTVTLLEDISLDGPDSAIVIDGKDITFDGDDHSVTQKYWSGTVSKVGDNVFRVKNGATVTFKDLYVTTMLGGEYFGSMSPAFECLAGTHTTFERVTSHTTRFLDIYGTAVLRNVEVRAHPKDIATSSYPDCAFKFNGGAVTIDSGRYDGMFYVGTGYGVATCNINGGTFYGMSSGEASFDYVNFNIANGDPLFQDDANGISRGFLTRAKSLSQQIDAAATSGFLTLGPRETKWHEVKVTTDHATFYTNDVALAAGIYSFPDDTYYNFTVKADSGCQDPKMTIGPTQYTNVTEVAGFVVNTNLDITVSAVYTEDNYDVAVGGVTTAYTTFAQAVAAAKAGGVATIAVHKDGVTLSESFPADADGMTLNLNGFTLAIDGFAIPADVRFTISGQTLAGGTSPLTVNGELDLTGVTGIDSSCLLSVGAAGKITAADGIDPNSAPWGSYWTGCVAGAKFVSGTNLYNHDGTTWVLDTNKAMAYVQGVLTGYPTLSEAIAAADDNTVVTVVSSLSTSSITIDKNLTIESSGDAAVTGTSGYVLTIGAGKNVTLRNLTLTTVNQRLFYANGGNLTIESGYYNHLDTRAADWKTNQHNTGSDAFFKVDGTGTITVNGGTLWGVNGYFGGSGKIVVNGGRFEKWHQSNCTSSNAVIADNGAKFRSQSEGSTGGTGVKTGLQNIINTATQTVVGPDDDGYYMVQPKYPMVTVTIVKSTGIGTITTNNAEVDFGSESSVTALVRKYESVTFDLAAADIIVPAFKVQVDEETAVCTNQTFTYKVVSDGETLTFTATAAGSDADITQDEAKRAIKESISMTGADKTAVEAKVDALCVEQDGDAKAVAKWIEDANGGITSETIRDSKYTKASMNLAMTSVITNGSPITVERVTGTGCISIRYKIGTTVLQLGASETTRNYVQISTSSGVPGGWVPWGSASAELQAIVGISDGTITLTPGTGHDYVYERVVLSED